MVRKIFRRTSAVFHTYCEVGRVHSYYRYPDGYPTASKSSNRI